MPQQPFSDAFSAHSQNKQNASQARRAAEALFQSSENSTPSRARRAQKRPIRAVSNITSVRRYVFSRLLHLARYSRQLEFVELPFDHEIYNQKFKFDKGLPKIHQHDNKPPQGFGLIYEGRLVCFYSYESDLGNGWEDQRVHNDPPSKRLEALQMGANIVSYAFTQN